MKSFLTIIICLTTIPLLSKDKGIGILSVFPGSSGSIEINIYERNASKSELLGSFNCKNTADGQAGYEVQIKGLETDNLVEFEYEKNGLPISEVKGKWVKVICGYDKSGKALEGWIEHRDGVNRYFLWKDYFKEMPLFFESTDNINFFNAPNGRKVEFRLQPSKYLKYDYIMKPVLRDGIWMKVEVTTPSDYCNTPESKETKVFWIKYLDERGRPLVWYFTRGC
jgi:hypothetical protein